MVTEVKTTEGMDAEEEEEEEEEDGITEGNEMFF